jgi:ubiquinone/menaquinone biosynthesis C-methylase UbiE
MQEVIPEKIVIGTIGLDLGCGCGWDTYLMSKSNPSVRILGIDISDGVYNAHRLNNSLNNVNIIKGSTEEIPLKNEVCDFVYSFGVLHHTPNYKKGLLEIERVLKKGSPCFLYLYEDHSESIIKYIAVRIIKYLRRITVKMPPKILYTLCCVLSPFVFIIFSLPSKILRKFKIAQHFIENMPFNFGITPFSLSGHLYDRFNVPVEYRFSRKEVYGMFMESGFYNVYITRLKNAAGWVAWAIKNKC